MVVVSYSGKEINAKLVYYGCGLCGKTTNLESIYDAVPDTSRGKMVSMKTQSDRTLFFDLLPLDLGEIMGFKTRFLLYTVPGQVFYNATRKLVLKGADAIVFVADSEIGKMEENKESLENLRTNLAEYSVKLEDLPWVIQYNKRDLPNVYSIEELETALNPNRVPYFEAVAPIGKGVFETFRGISHLLMEKVTKELRRGGSGAAGRTAAKPAEPAANRAPAAPSRAEAAAAAAPPSPPARAIEQEARETRAAAPAPPEPMPSYGREMTMPESIPPAETKPAAPARLEIEPAPAAMEHARSKAPEAPTAPPRLSDAKGKGKAKSADVAPAAPAASPAAVAESAEATTVVVPVQLPAAGTTGEIVIRIVFERKD